jgi:type VI secretion system VasD/TssJ family lipoprotein
MDPTTPRLCLRVEASPRLNFFSGQPHVVRLVLYPLESSLAFEQMDPDVLLRGEQPAGVVGAAIQVKLVPGETRELGDPLPASVRTIGVVADFYRAPGAKEGRRTATVAVNCAQGSTRVPLGENGIELE